MHFHGRLLNNSKFSPVPLLGNECITEQLGAKREGPHGPSNPALRHHTSHAEGKTAVLPTTFGNRLLARGAYS